MTPWERALRAVRGGEFVLIYDGDHREGEVDMVVASEMVEPWHVAAMRRDGGGLICVTVDHPSAEKLGLPFLTDILSRVESLRALSPHDIPYDEKSSFSITINHRRTFTGITDRDRALTISEFGKLVRRSSTLSPADAREELGRNFRSPGHVHVLRASSGLLDTRRGHTEMATFLVKSAGLSPSAAIVEMLSDDGGPLPLREAREYAEKHGYVLLTYEEVMDAWERG